MFSASVQWLQNGSLANVQRASHLSKLKQKLKKSEWSWFVERYFLFNYFPVWLSMAAPDNRKQ